MRRYAAIALVVLVAAGCSKAEAPPAPPAQPAVSSSADGDAHSRSVQLVQTAYPTVSTADAETMMRQACTIVGANPTPSGVLAARSDLVQKGVGSTVQVTTLLSAAVAGSCPEHLGALDGI